MLPVLATEKKLQSNTNKEKDPIQKLLSKQSQRLI